MNPLPSSLLIDRFRRDLDALWNGEGRMGLAVSGGPDSLALLLLAAASHPGRFSVATVDHGLRRESASEARAVGALCDALGCPHESLGVTVAAGGEGLQGEARRVRYAALGAWMDKQGLPVLLTGHHADDQAETLLMRLQRGSGVGGLAGVRAKGPVPGGRGQVLRPLLGWRRAELADIVRHAGLHAADDPSNRDAAFDRVRIRRDLAGASWIDPVAVSRSAAALAEADEALEIMTQRLWGECVEAGEGLVCVNPRGVPAELLRRIVLRCLQHVSPAAVPRGEQVAALLDTLRAGGIATLAGVKCEGGAVWHFAPAPPRRAA